MCAKAGEVSQVTPHQHVVRCAHFTTCRHGATWPVSKALAFKKIMEHESINVLKKSELETEFSFVSGKEVEATDHLLSLLDGTYELSLANDQDEEGEGRTSVKYQNNEFLFRNGGHGWSGDWSRISKENLRLMIIELAPHNDGSHWSLVGRLRKC